MKKIETSAIVGNAGLPIIKATHDQWNENSAEITSSIIKGLLGSYTTGDLIVLHGCVVTIASGAIPGTGTANNTAGAIYYNGEIYQVDANASLLSTTNPQTLVWQIVTTYRAGDPVYWSDGVARNQHREDKMHLVAATAGSGLANYDNTSTLPYLMAGGPNAAMPLINSYTTSAGLEPRYRKDFFGNVRFAGLVISPASGTPDPNCFQVPNSIKPRKPVAIPISNSSQTDPNAVLYIETNGNARIYSASSSGVLSPVANSLSFDIRPVIYNPAD